MFDKGSFSRGEAQKKLSELKGEFEFRDNVDISVLNDQLEKVIFALNIFEDAPKFVITRALYDGEKKNVLSNARFVVRPRLQNVLRVKNMKRVFAINAGTDFFDLFIQNMAEWFDDYNYYAKLESNLGELNDVVAGLIIDNGIQFNISFSLGNGFVDVSDAHAVVGVSEEVAMNLGMLPLFDNNVEARVENYKEKIVDTLNECARPFDIVKIKNQVTKDLNIYSRKMLSKLMRKIFNRKEDFVRVGVGYIDKDGIFSVVEKTAVSEDAVNSIPGVIVLDNENISAVERKKGETKIIVGFKVSPFSKDTGEPVDMKLEELLG